MRHDYRDKWLLETGHPSFGKPLEKMTVEELLVEERAVEAMLVERLDIKESTRVLNYLKEIELIMGIKGEK